MIFRSFFTKLIKIKIKEIRIFNVYVVVGCCRGVDCITVLVVVDRGFNREVFVGIESDSLSVDGDRAE
jgi:hypothetical protein